jgi:hypothetical protein
MIKLPPADTIPSHLREPSIEKSLSLDDIATLFNGSTMKLTRGENSITGKKKF